MSEQSICQPDKGWNFNHWAENQRAILKPLCQRIEKLLELHARRLYRYFASVGDGWDDYFERESRSCYYRGMHIPFLASGCLPPGLRDYFYPRRRGPRTGNEPPQTAAEFDDLIYIRHSTCADQTGCAITYAHELQHVVQHARFPELMKMNRVLRKNLKIWESTATEIDIPAERDANIASKRVAEVVCGIKAVRIFAEEQIRLMKHEGAVDQVKRWKFFRDISSCDLQAETLALAQKHKKALVDLGIDVDQLGSLDG